MIQSKDNDDQIYVHIDHNDNNVSYEFFYGSCRWCNWCLIIVGLVEVEVEIGVGWWIGVIVIIGLGCL